MTAAVEASRTIDPTTAAQNVADSAMIATEAAIAADAAVERAATELAARFEDFAFSAGLEAWMAAVFACNAYVDATAPWALRKSDPDRMAEVLGTLVVAIRTLAEAVVPVIPTSAQKLIATTDELEKLAPSKPAKAATLFTPGIEATALLACWTTALVRSSEAPGGSCTTPIRKP